MNPPDQQEINRRQMGLNETQEQHMQHQDRINQIQTEVNQFHNDAIYNLIRTQSIMMTIIAVEFLAILALWLFR